MSRKIDKEIAARNIINLSGTLLLRVRANSWTLLPQNKLVELLRQHYNGTYDVIVTDADSATVLPIAKSSKRRVIEVVEGESDCLGELVRYLSAHDLGGWDAVVDVTFMAIRP